MEFFRCAQKTVWCISSVYQMKKINTEITRQIAF